MGRLRVQSAVVEAGGEVVGLEDEIVERRIGRGEDVRFELEAAMEVWCRGGEKEGGKEEEEQASEGMHVWRGRETVMVVCLEVRVGGWRMSALERERYDVERWNGRRMKRKREKSCRESEIIAAYSLRLE